MFKKISLPILTVLFWVFSSYAQVAPDVMGSITNASSLVAQQRSAAVDVDLFTGIPRINIPLYSYRRGDLNLDMSLTYFAGGIQTEEDATETGMGWSLNRGGSL